MWAFRLGGDEIVPVEGQPLPELTAIPYDDDPDVLAHGLDVYTTHCMLCHGAGGASGGALADLRYAAPATYDIIQNIVRQGAFAGRGMPNLGHIVTEEDVDAVIPTLKKLERIGFNITRVLYHHPDRDLDKETGSEIQGVW